MNALREATRLQAVADTIVDRRLPLDSKYQSAHWTFYQALADMWADDAEMLTLEI